MGSPQPAGSQVSTVLAAVAQLCLQEPPENLTVGAPPEGPVQTAGAGTLGQRGRARNPWQARGRGHGLGHVSTRLGLSRPVQPAISMSPQRPSPSPHRAQWVCRVRGRAGHMNPQTSALKVAGEKHMSFPVWDLEPARTPLKARQVRAPPRGGGGEGLSSCHQQALCAALPPSSLPCLLLSAEGSSHPSTCTATWGWARKRTS